MKLLHHVQLGLFKIVNICPCYFCLMSRIGDKKKNPFSHIVHGTERKRAIEKTIIKDLIGEACVLFKRHSTPFGKQIKYKINHIIVKEARQALKTSPCK